MIFPSSPLTQLLKIKYPIIQAGMVWVSGAKLAAASANEGILGVIGAGSMNPELLEQHLIKAKSLTSNSLAVNIPLLYDKVDEQVEMALKHNIKIFITSAGSPKKFTTKLQDHGAVVMHVTSSPELAIKCQNAGVDAIIAEGFEAGGHNGRDEITTMSLIPQVKDAVDLPIIAAGGIGDGRGIAAAFALGAQGVQMGSRFVAVKESSAHENFKRLLIKAKAGDTKLVMKELTPVRLLKNKFYFEIEELEQKCASKEQLALHLGKGRAKKGMLEGDIENGELEIGQVCSLFNEVLSTQELIAKLKKEYQLAVKVFS